MATPDYVFPILSDLLQALIYNAIRVSLTLNEAHLIEEALHCYFSVLIQFVIIIIYNYIFQFLLQRLSVAIQRGNSTSVLGTLSSFDGLDDF